MTNPSTFVRGWPTISGSCLLLPSEEAIPRPASQTERVLSPPSARRGPPATGTVRLSRSLDPEKRIDKRIPRVSRGSRTHSLSGGIAPVAGARRALTVATGVDDEVLAADSPRDFCPVSDVHRVGEEVGDVQAEAIRVGDS